MHKFDEMYEQLPYAGAAIRQHYKRYDQWLAKQPGEVMRARREVKESLRSSDAKRLAAARASVDAAKIALGERGPVWWDDGTEFDRHVVTNTPYADWYVISTGRRAGRLAGG